MFLIRRFVLMIQFLTTIPIPFSIPSKEDDYGKGLVFAPFVGLLLGGIMVIIYSLLESFFPFSVLNVMVFIAYIILTGGLHLDGLGDTFDGLFSNRSKDKILEIMRDSRVGTNAVLAIASVFVLNIVLLNGFENELIKKVLLLMPVAGRMGSLTGAGFSVYARSNGGLGKSFIDSCGKKEVIFGALIHIGSFYIVLGNKGLIQGLLLILSSFFIVRLLSYKIDGATGDVLGAVCELNQTLFLILTYLFFS